MILAQPHKGVFLRALKGAFDYPSLSYLINENTSWRYDAMTSRYEQWPLQIAEVLAYFEMHNRVEQLVAIARDARPNVPEFAGVGDASGFTELPAEGLEAIVRTPGDPYMDVEVFRSALLMLERSVCQVNATLAGTGTLIGPKLVITNRHVVAAILSGDNVLSGPVNCVFDKKLGPDGYKTPETSVKVARVLASSPHAPADVKKGPLAEAPKALDYVLLELVRAIDEEPVVEGGAARGHVTLKDDVTAPAQSAGVLVLQHPADAPMKIDIGGVMQAGTTRMRHSVNTKKGSSGAPVFDASLNMVAIHHAGHLDWPAVDLGYNQAIPMAAIIADARAKGVAI
jgi:hypothetical protein